MDNNIYKLFINGKIKKIKNIIKDNPKILNEQINDGKCLIHYCVLTYKQKLLDYIIKINSEQLLQKTNDNEDILRLSMLIGINEFTIYLIDKIQKYYPEKIIEMINNVSILSNILEMDNIDIVMNFLDKYFNNINWLNKDFNYINLLLFHHYKNFDRIFPIIEKIAKKDKEQILADVKLLEKIINLYELKFLSLEILQKLIKLYPNLVNISSNNHSILIHIINNKNIELFKLFIDNGADYNYISGFGCCTPIYVAVMNEMNEIIEILLKQKNIKKTINFFNSSYETPLCVALQSKKITKKILKEMINLTDDLNHQNLYGNTPIYLLLMREDYYDFFDVLENREIDLYIQNKNDKTPIDNIKIENDKNDNINKLLKIASNNYVKSINKQINIIPKNYDKYCEKLSNECHNFLTNYFSSIKSSLPIQKDKKYIILDDYIHVNYSLYNARDWDIDCYIYCLLKKYDNLTIPYCSPEGFNKNIDNIKLLNNNSAIGNGIDSYINFWKTNRFQMLYYMSIYWGGDKNNYYIPYNFYNIVKDTIEKKTKKFLLIRIDFLKQTLNHANILLIDIEKKYIIRFEPYGGLYVDNDLDIIIKNYFIGSETDNYFIDYVYFTPNDYLPVNGFQSLSNENNSYIEKKGDIGGFCAAWCLWFVELYIKNNNVKLNQIIDKTIKKLINLNVSITEHIRDYSNYLFEKQKTFLLNNKFNYDYLFYLKYYDDELVSLFTFINNLLEKK
jgi:hypothetical protein